MCNHWLSSFKYIFRVFYTAITCPLNIRLNTTTTTTTTKLNWPIHMQLKKLTMLHKIYIYLYLNTKHWAKNSFVDFTLFWTGKWAIQVQKYSKFLIVCLFFICNWIKKFLLLLRCFYCVEIRSEFIFIVILVWV